MPPLVTLLEIPDSIANLFDREDDRQSMPRWALEAILIEGVRLGKISGGYLRDSLNLSFDEGESLLKSHGVFHDFSADELAAEVEYLTRVCKP